MNIGIILHSRTGNTLSVAEKLREELLSKGHSATIERVVAVNEDPSASAKVELKEAPNPSPYDALILAAPVQAFSLSPVMKKYLSQFPSLSPKKVGCFVTQHFPYGWMGGNNALRQMKNALRLSGTEVFASGVVNWSNKNREKIMSDVIIKLVSGL